MKKTLNIILCILALVFLFSAGMVIYRLTDYKKGSEEYEQADALVAGELQELDALPAASPSVPAEEDVQEDLLIYPYARIIARMDIDALTALNADAFGWIYIPGMDISYPLVQGADNYFYLSYTYKRSKNAVGAIFMDYRCEKDMSGYNTIIYGHRMNNGSMFAPLKGYLEQETADACPYIYVNSNGNVYQYTIFSAYEGDASGFSYTLSFADDAAKQEYLDAAIESSVIETAFVPDITQDILTLSTCTGNGHVNRMIVHGALTGFLPKENDSGALEQ